MQQLNADYNAKFGFPFILAVRGPRGTACRKAADHRDLRAPARRPPRLRARRVPAQHPPHRRDPPRTTSSASRPSSATRSGTGPSSWRTHSDPGYAEQGQLTVTYLTDAHRACARAAAALDEGLRLRRGRRSTRSATSSASTTAADPARRKRLLTGIALRHRAQRRQVRRPPRHLRADGLRARAAPRRPAPAVRLRGRRLRRGGRPALQGDLPRLGRADRPLRPGAGSTSTTPTASRCARRCAHAGLPGTLATIAASCKRDPARLPRLRRGAHRAGPGAQRARPAARRRHLDQRQRALSSAR